MSKLYFRYAAMNAGKSLALLQVAHNYEEQGRAVAMYTAAIDDRYSAGMIASRLGVQRDAATFTADTDFELAISTLADQVSCVLIDEAQFLTKQQVRQLHVVAHAFNIPVIAFGIRSDFMGEPFEGSAWLLTLADDLEELKTICSCGRKATMNLRVDNAGNRVSSGPQVEIGGNGRYKQVCARCFYARSNLSGIGRPTLFGIQDERHNVKSAG